MSIVKNKIIFITGATSGIGAACAAIFAEHGAHLLLCGRRVERLRTLTQELEKKYANEIHYFELDVRDANAVASKIAGLPEKWRSIDILINNAGLAAGLDKIQHASLVDWEAMIDTNIKGLLYITRAILPSMVQRNQGHIINVGSLAGHEIYPGGSVYCATKHAVKAISKGLKLDLLGTKIRVSSVDPGMVKTEFAEVRFKADKEKAEAVYRGVQPLTPHDIADAIYYCASRPSHVNISEMILLSINQGSANHVFREE